MQNLSLYIHFPYCMYKCHYCDFNSYAVKEVSALEKPYIEALLEEIRVAKRCFELPKLKTVFLGGGTPSLFTAKALNDLLESIDQELGILSETEITLESNPKTLNRQKVRDFKSAGLNRFSIGVQSFQDRFLSPLGRLHSSEEAQQSLAILEEETENYNFDLMFAFPGQNLEDLRQDLKIAAQFRPQHLSFYGLTLEEGTIFAEHHRQGKIQLLEDDLQAQMYETGVEAFAEAGYPLYEISNFAKPGYESQHNLAYWHYENYLGLGAGAFSFLNKDLLKSGSVDSSKNLYGLRWMNAKSPELYRQNPGNAYQNQTWEKIDFETARKEFWMMGLRLQEGISIAQFENRFGAGMSQIYRDVIESWQRKGGLELLGDKICLTPKGRLLANEVVSSFFI